MFYLTLAEIKDYYSQYVEIEHPMTQVEILKPLADTIRERGFPPIIVIVKKIEISDGNTYYRPLKQFEFLIQATKMAFATGHEYTELKIPCILNTETCVHSYEMYCKIRKILDKGEMATSLFIKKLKEAQKLQSRFLSFAEMVNKAEVADD